MRIKRLYEADDVQELPMNDQMPLPQEMPQMAPPAPVQSPAEMMPDFNFQENPEQGQQALPQPDVMNLTVRELIDRCNAINPLICMGLQQFIDSNTEEILNQTTGEAPEANDVPEEYYANLDMSGKRIDLDLRSELKFGTVDFVASKVASLL
jgi:hypothetical protein